jgi:hypothetical protein
MEAVRTSETSADNYFTRQYIPKDNSEHHTRRRENLKSHIEILRLPCEYKSPLINFVANNLEHFQTNSITYCIYTMNKTYLHRPTLKLSYFLKSVWYAGIRIFNSVPLSIKIISDKEEIYSNIKNTLNNHNFQFLDKFLQFTRYS